MGDMIYRLKDGIDLNGLAGLDYTLIPGTEVISGDGEERMLIGGVFVKIAPQELEGEVVQGSLNGIYNNPKWKEAMYSKNPAKFFKVLGLKYNKKGQAVLTRKFKDVITSWRIQIDTEDGWVGFTSADKFDQNIFYGKTLLDKYCEKQINELKEKGLIEEYELSE